MLARAAVGELDGGARRRRPPDALPRALDRVRSPASGARQIETVTRSENAARGTVGRLFDLHRVGDDGSLRIVGRHAAGARECRRRRARHPAADHSGRLRRDREPEPVQPHPHRHPEGRPGRCRPRGDAAEPLRRGPGRRSVHRLSGGSRQQAGVRLPAREFSGRWTIRAIESSHIVLERRNPRLEVQLIHDPSRPKPSLPVVMASAEGSETTARPVATDSRTDTVSSVTLSTPLAAPPLAARPPVSSFGIVAPSVRRAR